MSGENKRTGMALLPAIVVAVGAYFLVTGMRAGTLTRVALKPVNWAGLSLMVVGLAVSLIVRKKPMLRLLGVLLCGVGAVMVICL